MKKIEQGTWAYSFNGLLFIPEVRFYRLPSGHYTIPLKGYAHTLAVMHDRVCKGWILYQDKNK